MQLSTSITGTFDYNVVFARDEDPADVAAAPILTSALQEELGLKLERTKSQVDVLIVDHVEKPTPN